MKKTIALTILAIIATFLTQHAFGLQGPEPLSRECIYPNGGGPDCEMTRETCINWVGVCDLCFGSTLHAACTGDIGPCDIMIDADGCGDNERGQCWVNDCILYQVVGSCQLWVCD
jgi:hypothetical protein